MKGERRKKGKSRVMDDNYNRFNVHVLVVIPGWCVIFFAGKTLCPPKTLFTSWSEDV